ARYKNCSEFIDSLEKSCAGAKNWKPMPRGGSLNAPTIAEAPAPAGAATLPPPRRPARGGTTTVERVQKRKSGFLPFLAAILMGAALWALMGWKAGPWSSHEPQNAQTNGKTRKAAADQTKAVSASEPSANAPAPAAQGATGGTGVLA